MKKAAVIFFLFLPFILFPGNGVKFSAGMSYTEEAYIIIFRKQVSPYLHFVYEHTRMYKNIRMKHAASLTFSAWPAFIKNNKINFTDKTFALDMPAGYEFSSEVPAYSRFRFLTCAGFIYYTRWDRYSLGTAFWFSEFRQTPMPFAGIGFAFDFIPRTEVIFKDCLGAMISLLSVFNKDIYEGTYDYLNLYNKINFEMKIKIHGKYGMILGWVNAVNIYYNYNSSNEIFAFFHNNVYMGVAYEF